MTAPAAKAELPASPGPAEVTEPHTRLLRLGLAVDESRAYWSAVEPALPVPERARRAFEERWFGGRTSARVKELVPYLALRFDSFPDALAVLRLRPGIEPAARRAICHWHVQLTDPIYRRFTGRYLLERRELPEPKVDRAAVIRWLRRDFGDRWGEATLAKFAQTLLGTASEAGLVSARRDPRTLAFPKVPDEALAYLLYLLRGIRHEGSLTENPYVASVGLGGGLIEARARSLPGVELRRMNELLEVDWSYPNLLAWAEAMP